MIDLNLSIPTGLDRYCRRHGPGKISISMTTFA